VRIVRVLILKVVIRWYYLLRQHRANLDIWNSVSQSIVPGKYANDLSRKNFFSPLFTCKHEFQRDNVCEVGVSNG